VVGIETTRQFEGRYHELHNALSPLRGIGPDALKIGGPVERIGQGEIKEAITATNLTVEGEATAV
jgi:recombination protein RecR